MRGSRQHKQAALLLLGLRSKLLLTGFEEFNRRTTAQRLQPEAPRRIDMSAWKIPGRGEGRVRQNNDGKLKPLRSVYGHHPNTFCALLDDRRVLGLPGFCIVLDALYKGAKRRSTTLFEAARQVDHPQAVG